MDIRISGLGLAVPPLKVPQKEALDFLLENLPMSPAVKTLYERVMTNPSIQTRSFALDSLSAVLEKNHDAINQRFQETATKLSTESLNAALDLSGQKREEIDFIAVTTCTGYLCPGLSSYVAEGAKLRSDVQRADLAGMGCGAALPALLEAHNFLKAHPNSTAAVVATEICSAAMFAGDAPDIIVSNAIFADGSAALLLTNKPATTSQLQIRLLAAESLLIPEWRDSIRFVSENGYLRNVLAKDIPQKAGEALMRTVSPLLKKAEVDLTEIDHWIVHAGGKKILDEIERAFKLNPEKLNPSRAVLREFGNLSSPSVLFVLNETLQAHQPKPGDYGLLASFGAGFSAYAALVQFS